VSASSHSPKQTQQVGKLSASAHVTVLLNEAVDALEIASDGIYVDCTFGRGGHSRAILQRLGAQGRLIALDRDLAAVQVGQQISDSRFLMVHAHFSNLRQVLQAHGLDKVDGVLLDLGISSPQIDEAQRGFSFRQDGPLDMRMDQTQGETAAEFLAQASEQKIAEVIKTYGEERFAKQIARAIVEKRTLGAVLLTTRQLASIVAGAIPKVEPGQDPATRTFQAIRIYLNQELEELASVLRQCLQSLTNNGRMAVISFHSLEDRMVKHFIRDQQQRDDLPAKMPILAKDLPKPLLQAVGKAIKPSAAEVKANPRSRSAVLRVAQRTAEPLPAEWSVTP